MTSLERAKAFVRTRACSLACAIVPLASLGSLAVPASATAILNPGSCTITAQGASGVAPNSACSSSFISPGGVNLFGDATSASFSGGAYGLTFDWTGTGSGDAPVPIPANYNFTIQPSDLASVDYTLQFLVNSNLVLTVSGTTQSGFDSSTITGSTTLDFVGTVRDYEVKLIASEPFGTGYNQVRVFATDPNGIQLNVAPVPEPASWLLAGKLGHSLLTWS
jgi:hypothetical protein